MNRRTLFALLVAALVFPSATFAVTGKELIPSWVKPSQSQVYQSADHVILTGTWQLPAYWAGFLEVYQDADIDPNTKFPLTIGTLMTDVNTGKTGYFINNSVGAATTSGSFSIDLGVQPTGAHNLYIKFWGGTECALNTALNELVVNGISNRTPACGKSEDNFAPGIVWPAREYSVALPLWPVMVITPSSTPALNFANTTFGTQPTRSFTIENKGGSTLVGSLTVNQPFSCASSGCGYTVNPGSIKTIIVTFSPTSSPASFSSPAEFSCGASAPAYGCEGTTPGGTVYQNYQVIGNSVDSATPPAITLSRSAYNYGQENLGIKAENVNVTVTNSGGGLLNGAMNPPTPEYTCVGNPACSYSLFAGEAKVITIQYVPQTAGTHAGDIATFTGGTSKTVTLQSVVNSLPIVAVYNHNSGAWGTYGSSPFGLVNVGKCVQQENYLMNTGAGLLSGSVSGVPIDVGGALKKPGFSCISADCNYSNVTNNGSYRYIIFQFCPSSSGLDEAWAKFSNTLNPMASGTIYLYGNGNVLPIGDASTMTINFPDTMINTTVTRTVTITNVGAANLIGTVGTAVLFPSVYKCVNTGVYGDTSCNFNIPAGESSVFTFSFTPTAVQDYDGDRINVPGPGLGFIGLNGSGVQPSFKISYAGYPGDAPTPVSSILPPSPKSYDVGTTIFGGSASVKNKTFYIYAENLGSGAKINYTFNNTAHFVCLGGVAYWHGCSDSFPTGDYDTIAYEFQPTGIGDVTEPIIVNYDYNDGVTRTLQLDVTGHSISTPYLFVDPLVNIELGNIAVGATATAKFRVSNEGIGSLDGAVTIPSISTTSDPLSGLITRWTFDSADINWTTHQVTDSSGGGNPAQISGPVSGVGKYGQGLNFNGQGSISAPSLSGFATGDTPHTMAMWIKVNKFPSYRAWISVLGQWGYGAEHWLMDWDGEMSLGVWGAAQLHPWLSEGVWTHVALTYDGSNLRSYVNGVLDSGGTNTISTSGDFDFDNSEISMGEGLYYGEDDFNGTLDDVRIFNRALSASEIAQVYTGASVPLGLLAQWTFDDPTVVWSQMKVLDTSSKANNLTLSDVATPVTGQLGQALNFTPSYDVQVASTKRFTDPQDFSIGVWFKTSSASGKKIVGFEDQQFAYSGSYDRHIYMGDDGKIHFGVYDGSAGQRIITSINQLDDGSWHHALATHDASGNNALYIDGALQGTLTGMAEHYSGYWRVGGYKAGWSYMNGSGFFPGAIDDVRIYNRALSAAEALAIHQRGISGGETAFTCISNCTWSGLLNGQSRDVTIQFVPPQAISYIAYPLFTSNGGNIGYPSAPYPSVSGTGVLDPMIAVFPSSISFPLTNLGLSSRKNLVIENTGLGDLSGSVSPVRSGGLTFYCLSNCNFNLRPGATTTAVIEFSPNATGTISSTIRLTSNAKNVPILDVPVLGEGEFAPIIDPRGGDTNYGRVIVGKHKSQTFTLNNSNSTADLGSGTFVVTGPFKCTASDAGFDAMGNCLYTLNAGGSAVITITFSPTVVGGLPATSVNTGSVWLSGVPLARFFVQGIGVPPTVKFIEE